MNKHALLNKTWIAVGFCGLLCACAAEVPREPTQLREITAVPRVIELDREVTINPTSNYPRTLAAGSRWRESGRITQGAVFRPVNGVLTVEGKHVHEAYLVLDGSQVVGFYLPVEQAFTAVTPTSIDYQNKGTK